VIDKSICKYFSWPACFSISHYSLVRVRGGGTKSILLILILHLQDLQPIMRRHRGSLFGPLQPHAHARPRKEYVVTRLGQDDACTPFLLTHSLVLIPNLKTATGGLGFQDLQSACWRTVGARRRTGGHSAPGGVVAANLGKHNSATLRVAASRLFF
jgi:hypothetical protein